MDDLELLKRDLLSENQRCVDLFYSQVLSIRQIFTQSAFIEILIRLNDILQKLRLRGSRVSWNDNIPTEQNVKDITDLVNELRNAACHNDSQNNYISNSSIKFVFNTVVGKNSNAFQVGENQFLGNDYQDDIAFYYGDTRIYLVRHMKRLLDELPSYIHNLK